MTTKKCPQCGSRYFQIVDYSVVGYIYEVKDGYVIAEGADDGGEHVRTNCVCRNCNHVWHPKRFNFTIDENNMNKTIEERKNKCAYDLRVIGHDCENTVKEAYSKGVTEQNKIIRDRLIAMQGEYITIELINELFENEND